ncbi:hypothetical protein PSTT_07332, partial [Puccinia striiformis]
MSSELCPVYAPFFGAMGCTAAIVFTCIGASYGTSKSGVGISAMGVLRPDLMMKCIIPVVMAGIIATDCGIGSDLGSLQSPMPLYQGFVQLGAGLSVGLAGLSAGFAIGIVGDAGVRGTAQQPRLFVGMVLILIFAEVLGLYGLIVALILNTRGSQHPPLLLYSGLGRSISIDHHAWRQLGLHKIMSYKLLGSAVKLPGPASDLITSPDWKLYFRTLVEPAASTHWDSRKAGHRTLTDSGGLRALAHVLHRLEFLITGTYNFRRNALLLADSCSWKFQPYAISGATVLYPDAFTFPKVFPMADTTMDEPTLVHQDQRQNSISFEQTWHPKNPNRCITNGGGSCEDRVGLSSPYLARRLWLTKDRGPQRDDEKGLTLGTPSGALLAGFKRKTPDAPPESSARSEFPAQIALALAKLEDSNCSAREEYQELKVDERLVGPEEPKTTSISDNSISKTDDSNVLKKTPISDTHSPSRSGTTQSLSLGTTSRHTTPSLSDDTIGSKDQVDRQDQATNNTKLKRLKFDLDLFKSLAPSRRGERRLPPMLRSLFAVLGGNEFVMTEQQFVKYHGSAFRGFKLPKPEELHPEKRYSDASRQGYMRNQFASKFLEENQALWYKRYHEEMDLDLDSCIWRLSAASGKPLPTVKKLIILYLYFVEMISTIVPRDKKTSENIIPELKQALKVFESIYETGEPDQLILNHPALKTKSSRIRRALISKSSTGTATRVWIVLDIWLEISRVRFYDEIKRNCRSRAIDNPTKTFFWVVFSYPSKNSLSI